MKSKNSNNSKQKGLLWITSGLLLIAAALFLIAYNLYDGLRAEQSARQIVDRLEEHLPSEALSESTKEPIGEQNLLAIYETTAIPDYVLCPDMEMPVETIDGIDYIGVLAIPTLELELPIISQWSYPNLKIAPCRYEGSAYLGNLIVAAHNYSSHFGNLKNLRISDVVTFTDMNGNVFHYEVAEIENLLPTSVKAMESGDWSLTLFTCTIGGKSRVTVRCQLIDDYS